MAATEDTASKNVIPTKEQVVIFSTKKVRWTSRTGTSFTPETVSLEDSVRSDLRESLYCRYKLYAHAITNASGFPESYCYYDENEPRENAVYYPVKTRVLSVHTPEMFPPNFIKWTELNPQGKIGLRRILNVPISLWLNLQYGNSWIARTDDNKDHYSVLSMYGKETGHDSVLECLAEGLAITDLEPVVNKSLVSYWKSALISGMTNGEGRTAVFELFREIAALLPHVGITTPVMIYHITSSLTRDCRRISESSSSTSGPPPAVRQKMNKKPHSGKFDKTVQTEKETGWPTAHRHFVDLEVVCPEEMPQSAKYIALIEVHSRGKSDEQAENKFLQEVISVLQAQNAVFGFLFSNEYVVVYHAERDMKNKISIKKVMYDLIDDFTCPVTMNVGLFQMLMMDIFSCLVMGVEKIET